MAHAIDTTPGRTVVLYCDGSCPHKNGVMKFSEKVTVAQFR
jgi:hypothetical protein